MKLTVYMCVCVKACVRFGKHAHAQCENVCVCMHVCVCACERQLVLGGEFSKSFALILKYVW